MGLACPGLVREWQWVVGRVGGVGAGGRVGVECLQINGLALDETCWKCTKCSVDLLLFQWRRLGNILIKIFHLSIATDDDRWRPPCPPTAPCSYWLLTPLSNFQKGRRNIGRNCRHLIKVLRQGENSSVTKTKTIIFQFISDDREREERKGEGEIELLVCGPVWLESHCLFICRQASHFAPFPSLPFPLWHCQSVSGAFAVFHFVPVLFLLGKLFAISTISCTCRASQGEVFFGFWQAHIRVQCGRGTWKGESSPECRPCQVEYFSIVCRIHLAKFR